MSKISWLMLNVSRISVARQFGNSQVVTIVLKHKKGIWFGSYDVSELTKDVCKLSVSKNNLESK